jgi:hypothetical protein
MLIEGTSDAILLPLAAPDSKFWETRLGVPGTLHKVLKCLGSLGRKRTSLLGSLEWRQRTSRDSGGETRLNPVFQETHWMHSVQAAPVCRS